MSDTIRQDVIAIDFEVDNDPFSDVRAAMDDLLSMVQQVVGGAEEEFTGMETAATGAADGISEMASAAQDFDQSAFFDEATQDMQETAAGSQQATMSITQMATALKDAAASKISEIPEKIKSSATAAREFASMLKATTFDKVTSGAEKLKSGLQHIKGMTLKDVAKGLDTGLGKAATKGLDLARNIKDVAKQKLTSLVSSAKDAATNANNAAKEHRELAKEAKNAGDSASNASGGFGKFGNSIMDIAKGMFVFDLIKKGLDVIKNSISSAMGRIDATEQFDRVLSAMPSVQNAAEAMGVSVQTMVGDISSATSDIVTDTAYGLTTAMSGVQNLISRGIDPSKATSAIQAMADAVAFYADGSDASFGRVNDAMSKMITSGKVSMQELNMLMDAGIPALDIFADATGKSIADVRKEISSGSISAEDFMMTLTDALETGTESFPALAGAAQEAGATWTGTFDNMKAAVSRGGAAMLTSMDTLLENSGLPNARKMLLDLGRSAGDMLAALAGAKPAGEVIATLGERVGTAAQGVKVLAGGIANMIRGVAENLPALMPILMTVVDTLVSSAGTIVTALAEGLIAAAPTLITTAVQLISNLAVGFVQALPMILQLGMQLLESIINGIMQSLPILVQSVGQIVESFSGTFVTMLPLIIQLAIQLILTLVQGLISALPQLVQSAVTLVQSLVQGLLAALPLLIRGAIQLVMALVSGLISQLPMLIQSAITLVSSLVQGITEALPLILEAALELINELVQGLIDNIPLLISSAIQLILGLVTGLLQNLPALIQAAITLVLGLVQGLISAIPMLIQGAIQLVLGIVDGIISNLDVIILAALQVVMSLALGLIQAIPVLIAAIPQLIMAIIETIFTTNWLEVGWEVIKGIGQGLWNAVSGLWDWLTGAGEEAANATAEGATTGAEAAGQAAQEMGANVQSGTDIAASAMSGFDAEALSASYDVSAAMDNITASADGLGTSMSGAALTMGTDLNTMGTDMTTLDTTVTTATTNIGLSLDDLNVKMTETQTAMSDEMTTVITNVQDMATQVVAVFQPLAETLFAAGVNAMQGFNNGLESMRGAILATAQSIANEVAATMQAALAIHSPSKVIERLGRFAGMALPLGMETQRPEVEKEAQELALAAIPPVNETGLDTNTERRTMDNSPVSTGSGNDTHITNHNTPQFTLTIGSNATANDRELERKIKTWVVESFQRLIDNAERDSGSKREA